jgi:hypothetical protein
LAPCKIPKDRIKTNPIPTCKSLEKKEVIHNPRKLRTIAILG